MATGQWAVVLRHVQRLFQGEGVSGLSEGQLLERFATTGDEVAFGAILARHGPMVLGICRGVLDDPVDVEDAFQATFLVLVKKAGSLRDSEQLAQWLYGVARRVALRARSSVLRKRTRERPEAEATVEPHATLDAELRELQSLIREEVDRLSSNDRMAVVLCYLEGLTHEEAADRLGWPVGTVKGRLSRARDKLRGRLTRRGVALPAVALTASLTQGASASVPPALIRSTMLASIQLASGKGLTAGIVSIQAITLMEGVIGTMFTMKLKLGVAALVVAGVVTVPGVLAFQGPGSADGVVKTQVEVKKKTLTPVSPIQKLPANLVNPLPPDALRDEMARLSSEALETMEKLRAAGQYPTTLDKIYTWSRRLVEAKSAVDLPPAERNAALKEHRDRMERFVATRRYQAQSAQATAVDVLEAQFHLVEAERWLRDGGVTTVVALVETPPKPESFGGFGASPDPKPLTIKTMPGDEKRNQAILAKLEEIIEMNFVSDTPLEDVKKYIEKVTQDEEAGLPNGIPIYVNPEGLQDADKTMASTVNIKLKGIPLRTTLSLLLHQLSLIYRVEGGLLLITSETVKPPVAAGGGFN